LLLAVGGAAADPAAPALPCEPADGRAVNAGEEATMNATNPTPPPTAPKRELELPALVAIMWSLAGGMLLGGAGVALRMFAGNLSAHLMLVASTTLFVVGAVVGLTHGLVLGIFGRPEGHTARQAGRALAHGLLYLAPALLLGWLLAGWVAALPLAIHGGHVIAIAVSALAWLLMVVPVWMAVSTGAHAASLAWRRWPDRVLGTSLTGLVLIALLVAFWIEPPMVWLSGLQLTRTGGLFLAGALTFWCYGPLITLGLWLSRRMREVRGVVLPVRRPALRRVAGLALAVLAGVAVTLIAIPFYRGPIGLPSDAERLGLVAALLFAAASALTDELLLRLFVMTAVFAMAMRLLLGHRTWVVVIAVATAAVVDLALHAPAAAALGLPGTAALVAFVAVRLAIPAAVFGYLYWRRGLGSAMAAHVAANTALVVLAT
jgi:hypothetical protein